MMTVKQVLEIIKPKNYYSGYKGLSTVRDAIEISQNIIPLKIMAELTPQKSIEYLKKGNFIYGLQVKIANLQMMKTYQWHWED